MIIYNLIRPNHLPTKDLIKKRWGKIPWKLFPHAKLLNLKELSERVVKYEKQKIFALLEEDNSPYEPKYQIFIIYNLFYYQHSWTQGLVQAFLTPKYLQ